MAVKKGILDAPQLMNNEYAKGTIKTRIINGCCKTVNALGKPVAEKYRLDNLLDT